MHRHTPLSTQVYQRLYPHPNKERDPSSWQDHVKKLLVLEMRLEVQLFYGTDADSFLPEARFPGFDYSNSYHRMRLRRHTQHRRLFRVFDELRLTESEIYNLCDWEGTLIVRRRYEEQNNVKLRDTTGDEIVQRQERERLTREREAHIRRQLQFPAQRGGEWKAEAEMVGSDDAMENELEDEDEESDEEEALTSEPEDCPTIARLNLPGAVRHMRPEQYSQTRRLMNASARLSRAGTPAASAAA